MFDRWLIVQTSYRSCLNAACYKFNPVLFLSPSPRRPGPDGTGGVEAWDGLSPLHLACATGLDTVVQCLLEHKVNVNVKV